MKPISKESRVNAAAAARAWLSGESISRTTRQRPAPPKKLSQSDVAAQHKAPLSLTKKYIYLLKDGKPLPMMKKSMTMGGRPMALTIPEERALIEYLSNVENSAFAVTESVIRNYASYIRSIRIKGPKTKLSQAWVRGFKKRHPELQCNIPKTKEIQRASAETDIKRLDGWFDKYEAILKSYNIIQRNNWNFDESPLQIGWVSGNVRLFSIRKKHNTRAIAFQPGNKESLTSIDSINAAGQSIPSFLIFSLKSLLEEYTRAEIDEEVVLTHTETGFNNAQRGVQWLQHFNRHSFAKSSDFDGFTIKEWFGYPPEISLATWSQKYAYLASKNSRENSPVTRLLVMDGFSAHEDIQFIWYCIMFDIVPFLLPSHTSHILQPLDVGVYLHLKRAQRDSLNDFVAGGGLQITRFHFLNMWNTLYNAAFRACYIYVGWEKSGLWPVNREIPLQPLRLAAKQKTEPLFPKLLHPITPRKSKKQLNDIREKLQILSSPTREILRNVEASLDYAIIAKSAQLEIVKLQRERLAMEARRTGSRRRIRNEDGGAYTIKSLRKQVSQRQHEELLVTNKKQAKEQESWLKELRQKAQPPVDASGPKLRGRAAAKAKAEKEARDTAKRSRSHL
jgi:hypothetical protein